MGTMHRNDIGKRFFYLAFSQIKLYWEVSSFWQGPSHFRKPPFFNWQTRDWVVVLCISPRGPHPKAPYLSGGPCRLLEFCITAFQYMNTPCRDTNIALWAVGTCNCCGFMQCPLASAFPHDSVTLRGISPILQMIVTTQSSFMSWEEQGALYFT